MASWEKNISKTIYKAVGNPLQREMFGNVRSWESHLWMEVSSWQNDGFVPCQVWFPVDRCWLQAISDHFGNRKCQPILPPNQDTFCWFCLGIFPRFAWFGPINMWSYRRWQAASCLVHQLLSFDKVPMFQGAIYTWSTIWGDGSRRRMISNGYSINNIPHLLDTFGYVWFGFSETLVFTSLLVKFFEFLITEIPTWLILLLGK